MEIDKKKINREYVKFESVRTLGCVLGSIMYVAGVNLFLVPAGLYTGGVMGICQLIRTILVDYMHLPIKTDIAGIIFYIVNVPIFIYAFPRIEKVFLLKTMVSVTVITIATSLVPRKMIMNDVLAAAVMGAVISGAGAGIILRMSGSSGGTDVIGMVLTRQNGNMSVGKVNLFVNIVLYGVCLFLFDIQVAIYSVIFAVVYSFVIDRVHVQNINVEVKIITKIDTENMKQEIFTSMYRGITEWKAVGAYTDEASTMLYILISKYEINKIKSIVHKYDPHAFIIVNEGIHIEEGNYTKKL